jgi:hypothetical protein
VGDTAYYECCWEIGTFEHTCLPLGSSEASIL